MDDFIQLLPIPVVAGLVEIVKGLKIDSRYAPIASIVIGIAVSFLFGWDQWQWGVLNGIVYGLSASGLYSGTRALLDK